MPMHDVERLKVTGENQRLNSSSALHRPTRIDVHMLVDKQPVASKAHINYPAPVVYSIG